MKELNKVGNFTIDPVKTAIQLKTTSTFLSMTLKKDHIDIAFQLGEQIDDFPIYKAMPISKNRVLHYAVLEGPDDVDSKLIGWLRVAYKLAGD